MHSFVVDNIDYYLHSGSSNRIVVYQNCESLDAHKTFHITIMWNSARVIQQKSNFETGYPPKSNENF